MRDRENEKEREGTPLSQHFLAPYGTQGLVEEPFEGCPTTTATTGYVWGQWNPTDLSYTPF